MSDLTELLNDKLTCTCSGCGKRRTRRHVGMGVFWCIDCEKENAAKPSQSSFGVYHEVLIVESDSVPTTLLPCNESTRYPNIDRHLGLHQRLELLYVVDGFDAELFNEEGYPIRQFDGHGETIDAALTALDSELAKLPDGFVMKAERG